MLLTSLCLMSSAFSVLVAHRQLELETEVAELRAEMRTAELTAASEDVTFVRQRRLRREAGDQGGISMPSYIRLFNVLGAHFKNYFIEKKTSVTNQL